VVVLDLLGPEAPVLSGQTTPILDQLRPELDFGRRQQTTVLHLDGVAPVLSGAFPAGPETTEIKLPAPVTARQVCIECDSAHDGKPFAAIAEISLLGPNGEALPHTNWSIPYVDSEETEGEDGAASNAIDGQTSSFWHTEWHGGKPGFPHYLVIDLGSAQTVSALRYTPRQGAGVTGRIKEFRLYAGEGLAREKP
jgi:beta-galactosidase